MDQPGIKTLATTNKIFSLTLDSFLKEEVGQMRQALEMYNQIDIKTKKRKRKIIQTISKLKQVDSTAGYYYIQVVDYQREMAHSLHSY